MRQMHKALQAILAFLYPRQCLSCRTTIAAEHAFCGECQPFIQPVSHPFCSWCGAPFVTLAGPDHLCGRCLADPPAFRRARAWACYRSEGTVPHPLNVAIQHFKYQREVSVGKSLAALATAHLADVEHDYDVIVPVPLHPQRLRSRGFNQALIVSQAIGHAQDKPVDAFVLERTRPTPPQTQLSRSQRRANVRGAFDVAHAKRLAGKRVLLVDDVYTSGATVMECARALRRGSAKTVDVFTLARAV
jgi:ComF family protein